MFRAIFRQTQRHEGRKGAGGLCSPWNNLCVWRKHSDQRQSTELPWVKLGQLHPSEVALLGWIPLGKGLRMPRGALGCPRGWCALFRCPETGTEAADQSTDTLWAVGSGPSPAREGRSPLFHDQGTWMTLPHLRAAPHPTQRVWSLSLPLSSPGAQSLDFHQVPSQESAGNEGKKDN